MTGASVVRSVVVATAARPLQRGQDCGGEEFREPGV